MTEFSRPALLVKQGSGVESFMCINKKAGFYTGLFDTLYKRELKFFSAVLPRTTVNTLIY
jgi:hypothetical protein